MCFQTQCITRNCSVTVHNTSIIFIYLQHRWASTDITYRANAGFISKYRYSEKLSIPTTDPKGKKHIKYQFLPGDDATILWNNGQSSCASHRVWTNLMRCQHFPISRKFCTFGNSMKSAQITRPLHSTSSTGMQYRWVLESNTHTHFHPSSYLSTWQSHTRVFQTSQAYRRNERTLGRVYGWVIWITY